ncbi:hypothetical protein E6H15_04880 [Candidatus Bathyarchaeota archaeon]|nr:MAG: hypothetical protein E6H15_04880 [Candidatus Bathyarchaeota archaeon]
MPRKIGLAGGFGARYGTVARRQYVEIVTGLRSKHECPSSSPGNERTDEPGHTVLRA